MACCCFIVAVNYQAAIAQTHVQRKLQTARIKYTDLNGIWKIETELPKKEVMYQEEEYLPPDTLLKLEIMPPDRLAIQEGKGNELEGSVTLLPPYTQEICKTVFSQELVNSPTACRGGEIVDPGNSVSFNADFVFDRWNSRMSRKGPNKLFYLVGGMKPGDQLVHIDAIYKGATWKLWIRDRDTMIGECLLQYNSKEADLLLQTWRRVKTP